MTSSIPPNVGWGTPDARWILAATVGASGLALMDMTMVNVALAAINADLDARVAGLQWIVNAYTLAVASLILLSGSLADRYGRRRVFRTGIAWFAVASLLCAAAPTSELLITARALQGIGGALLTPGSLAIIQAAFVPGDRGRAIGTWAGLGGIGAAIGPLLGGWLVGAVSWRAIFWINLPIAVLLLWITARHVPESRVPTAPRFDLAGAFLGTLALGTSTWALIRAGESGATAGVLAAGAAGVAALIAFLVRELRARAPLVPLDLFRSRQFSGANLATFAVYGGMGGLFFLLVVYLQEVGGYAPLRAGSALLPVTVLMLVLSPKAGSLADRIGPRRPMTIGPLVMATGMLLLSGIGTDPAYLTDVLPGSVVFGLGLATTVAPLTTAALAAAGAERTGIASGVNNAVARTASLVVVAVLPVLSGLTGDAFSDPARFAGGFPVAMRIAAVMVATGGVIAWMTIRNETGDPPVQDPGSRMAA
jgi:EmrB/QacA subfamily drug resistance transporter